MDPEWQQTLKTLLQKGGTPHTHLEKYNLNDLGARWVSEPGLYNTLVDVYGKMGRCEDAVKALSNMVDKVKLLQPSWLPKHLHYAPLWATRFLSKSLMQTW